MNIRTVKRIFEEISDDPLELQQEGGLFVFKRRGKTIEVELEEVSNVGLCVKSGNGVGDVLFKYLQTQIFELPIFAEQIIQVVEKSLKNKQTTYIEGTSNFEKGKNSVLLEKTKVQFGNRLLQREFGATTIIQMMASAGQGKTILLESLACDFAKRYIPQENPSPLLLPVDLLGRYVGNIEDAIAGTLNNKFSFPLSQNDIIFCLKNNWLILALDGFDELVARIGSRDAFNRISDLLDQLDKSGIVILSARESFFDLHRITTAINTYLAPKNGDYSTATLKLLPWGKEQGVEIFEINDSPSPESDFDSLLRDFKNDQSLILKPFFLSRLVKLWVKGKKFEMSTDERNYSNQLYRFNFIFENLINREFEEKWKSKTGPLISIDEHKIVLGQLAEEMWRTGSYFLDKEEVELACRLAADTNPNLKDKVDDISARLGTHAALVSQNQKIAFMHDNFFKYALGFQLTSYIKKNEINTFADLINEKEIDQDIAQWFGWFFSLSHLRPDQFVNLLSKSEISKKKNQQYLANAGMLLMEILESYNQVGTSLILEDFVFLDESTLRKNVSNLIFKNCKFWQSDFSASSFEKCRFENCEFSAVSLDDKTKFMDTFFTDLEKGTNSFEKKETSQGFWDPKEIKKMLESLGAIVTLPVTIDELKEYRAIPKDIELCIKKIVKQSRKTCNVAIQDIEHEYKGCVREVVKKGIENNILRNVDVDASGPKKEFVRFIVDKQKLLDGMAYKIGDVNVDNFWDEISKIKD